MKYIICGTSEYPVIFPEFVDHSIVAQLCAKPVMSAGFCTIKFSKDWNRIFVTCHKSSAMKDIPMRGKIDSNIIEHMINAE